MRFVTSIYHQEIIGSREPRIQWEPFPLALLFCVPFVYIDFASKLVKHLHFEPSFFNFVIFMAIITELHKIPSNPAGFWMLSLRLR